MQYFPIVLTVACGLLVIELVLIRSARELSQKRDELSLADKQLAVYSLLCFQAHDGGEKQRIAEQAELSHSIYQNVAAEYNQCITKPKNRLTAWLLQYEPICEVKDYGTVFRSRD